MDFNFKRSQPIFADKVFFETKADGSNLMQIPGPGFWETPTIKADELQFVVSQELAASTGAPCFDQEAKTIGFADQQSKDYWLNQWGFA